jgi:hypothetical protein
MEQFENYYALFGVSRSASFNEIRTAYRRKCHEWHPDVNPEIDTTAIMQRLNRAKSILLNLDSRRQFDFELSRHESQNLNPTSGSDVNERYKARFQQLKLRVAEFQESDPFLYAMFEQRVRTEPNEALLRTCASWGHYQREFVDMVVLELHDARDFALNEIYGNVRNGSSPSEPQSDTAPWGALFKYIIWILAYALAHGLKAN